MAGTQVGSYQDVYYDLYSTDIVVSLTATIPLPTLELESVPPLEPATVSVPVSIPTPALADNVTVTPGAVSAPVGFGSVVAASLVRIYARDQSRFYRVIDDGVPRLVLPLGHNRSGTFGHLASEGWERVSSRFVLNADNEGHEAAMSTVAAAWAANKAASAATLLSAIDTALNAAGYRDKRGEAL